MKILEQMETALKWKSYRDSLHRFYLIDKVSGQDEYDQMIDRHREIIEKVSKASDLGTAQTLILIGKKVDGMAMLKFIAAAYEMLDGT